MSASFDRWLSRPSTIHFLRDVLSATDIVSAPLAPRLHDYPHVLSRHLSSSLPRCRHGFQTRESGEREVRSTSQADKSQDEDIVEAWKSPDIAVQKDVFQEQAYRALWMQANNTSSSGSAKLVVDRPEYRHDFRFWIEHLNNQQRLDGFPGVLGVWKSLQFRQVDLPTSGKDADAIWPLFITAAISETTEEKQRELLEDVLAHAKDLLIRTGRLWPGLYKCLVGQWLRVRPIAAWPWQKTFIDYFGVENIDLRELAEVCATSVHPAMDFRRRFKKLYKSTEQRDLYDHFIPRMLECADPGTALRWHQMFISEGDGPSTEIFTLPKVQWLFKLDDDKALPMVRKKKTESTVQPKEGAKLPFPPLTRETMSTLIGEAHGIRQKEVGDQFVAKMFATKAFPLDLVMGVLKFFSIERLGPLALRQIALRAGNQHAFQEKLTELKSMSVSVAKSTYGRLLHAAAWDAQDNLFDALLESDQHPEAFDDFATQQLLLDSFLANGDHLKAEITLMALSFSGKAQETKARNRVLRHHIKSRDYSAVLKTWQHMQAADLPPSRTSLIFMHKYLLPLRRPGSNPTQTPEEARVLMPLQFTANAYIFAVTHGIRVSPSQWVEILKRFAMQHRWDEFERVVRWLVSWYSGKDPTTPLKRSSRFIKQSCTLQTIFSREMKKAIVTWGFQNASYDQVHHSPVHGSATSDDMRSIPSIPCDPWAKGLWLLKDLNGKGLDTSPGIIRDALKLRLWILFGPACSTKSANEIARRHNDICLARYIRHANEIWEGRLFDVDSALLQDNHPSTYARLLIAVFGSSWRVNRITKEYADVVAYARAVAFRHGRPTGYNVATRRALWQNSPIRLIRRMNR